jgi:hypothetical protein
MAEITTSVMPIRILAEFLNDIGAATIITAISAIKGKALPVFSRPDFVDYL